MPRFKLYPALHEETDKGWVWLYDPKRFKSRMTIRITCGKKHVYCEYRELDNNFITMYNERPHTPSIDPEMNWHARKANGQMFEMKDPGHFADMIVIGGWYRNALGIPRGQSEADLTTDCLAFSNWADLRAACQHPEPGVRVSTRVTLGGTWLAVVGILFAFEEIVREPFKAYLSHREFLMATGALSLAVLFSIFFAGRGIKPTA